MEEIFKDIKNYEGIYKISNTGKVIRLSKSNDKRYSNKSWELKPQMSKKGYYIFNLCKNGKSKIYLLHRLIAEHFIDNKNNYEVVNHKDGNKLNNSLDNLEWCSFKDNVKHAYKNELMKNCKKICQYDKKNNFIKKYYSINIASKETNVNQGNISMCVLGKRKTAGGYIWKEIDYINGDNNENI